MSEPTIEEMKSTVIAVYPDAFEWFDEDGSWYISLPHLGEGLYESKEAWADAYSKLPAKAAPEGEDEAFEEWWHVEGFYIERI